MACKRAQHEQATSHASDQDLREPPGDGDPDLHARSSDPRATRAKPMSRNDRDKPPPPTKTTEPRPAWMRDPALLPRKPPRMPITPDRRRRDDPGA
jgi:hypothetical protein